MRGMANIKRFMRIGVQEDERYVVNVHRNAEAY